MKKKIIDVTFEIQGQLVISKDKINITLANFTDGEIVQLILKSNSQRNLRNK